MLAVKESSEYKEIRGDKTLPFCHGNLYNQYAMKSKYQPYEAKGLKVRTARECSALSLIYRKRFANHISKNKV